MYKLYAQNKKSGWQLIKTGQDLDEIELLAETIDAKENSTYMIIEHTPKGDRTVRRQELYQEYDEKEKVNNFKKKYKVETTTSKTSKMKQKEELRKMTEEYLKE